MTDLSQNPFIASEREKLFARALLWFQQSLSQSRKYHAQAREMTKSLSNKQQKDTNIRQEQDDTHIQFNKLAPLMAAVKGTLINNQRDLAYKVRAYDNSEEVNLAAEMVNNAATWIKEVSRGERAEVSAFGDAIAAGIGYVEVGVDYTTHRHGRYLIKRVDPQMIIFDSRAREPNMADARYLFRVVKMTRGEAMVLFPDAPVDELDAAWANTNFADKNDRAQAAAFDDMAMRKAFPESSILLGKTGRGRLTLGDIETDIVIVEVLWKEVVDIFRDKDGKEFTAYDFGKIAELPEDAQPVRRKEVSFRAFLGESGLLCDPVQPLCPSGQLPILPITCYFDEYGERYYGLLEAGIDAQTSINKLYTNYMFALDFSSKGGYIVQKDAIGDQASIKQFEDTIAKPDKVTLVNDLKGIMAKPTGNIPKDMFELFNLADKAIYDCTGLSQEYLGMADREQANVLELTRRQSTLNVLSEPFEHARYLRADMGRAILWLIKNTLPENTLMGVNGVMAGDSLISGGYKALKFNKKLVSAFDYDVIVDDTPASIDERTRTYELLKDLLTTAEPLVSQGGYQTAKVFIGASPLPASVAQRLMKAIDADISQNNEDAAAQQEAVAAQAQGAPPPGAEGADAAIPPQAGAAIAQTPVTGSNTPQDSGTIQQVPLAPNIGAA